MTQASPNADERISSLMRSFSERSTNAFRMDSRRYYRIAASTGSTMSEYSDRDGERRGDSDCEIPISTLSQIAALC